MRDKRTPGPSPARVLRHNVEGAIGKSLDRREFARPTRGPTPAPPWSAMGMHCLPPQNQASSIGLPVQPVVAQHPAAPAIACPPGTNWNAAAQACIGTVACPPGTNWNAAQQACIPPAAPYGGPPGYYPPGYGYGPPSPYGYPPGYGQPPQYGYGQPPQYGYGQPPQYGYGGPPGYGPPSPYGYPPRYGQQPGYPYPSQYGPGGPPYGAQWDPQQGCYVDSYGNCAYTPGQGQYGLSPTQSVTFMGSVEDIMGDDYKMNQVARGCPAELMGVQDLVGRTVPSPWGPGRMGIPGASPFGEGWPGPAGPFGVHATENWGPGYGYNPSMMGHYYQGPYGRYATEPYGAGYGYTPAQVGAMMNVMGGIRNVFPGGVNGAMTNVFPGGVGQSVGGQFCVYDDLANDFVRAGDGQTFRFDTRKQAETYADARGSGRVVDCG